MARRGFLHGDIVAIWRLNDASQGGGAAPRIAGCPAASAVSPHPPLNSPGQTSQHGQCSQDRGGLWGGSRHWETSGSLEVSPEPGVRMPQGTRLRVHVTSAESLCSEHRGAMEVKQVSAWGPGKDAFVRIFPRKTKPTTDSSRVTFKKSGFQANLISGE